MAYSGDRLYNEVIRKKLGELSIKIRVREIIPHLSCLTLSDREEIEAKRENYGNYNAVSLLIENLHRRENWPDQFIAALRACEHVALANEISEAYDRIRGKKAASAPASPPPAASVSPLAPPAPVESPEKASTTLTTATVHTVPHSTPQILTPSTETSAQSAIPNPVNSSPGPFPNITTLEAPALVSAPDAPVHPPPEPALLPEPPRSGLSADAGPNAPVSTPKLTPSFGPNKVPASSHDTSNLDTSGASVLLDASSESCSNVASPALSEAPAIASVVNASIQPPREPANSAEVPLLVLTPHEMPPSPVSAPKVSTPIQKNEVRASSVETAQQGASGVLINASLSGPSLIAAPNRPNNSTPPLSQVNKPATASQSSASPDKSNILIMESGSSSMKHPIQDSNPPGTDLARDSQNNPTINQLVKRLRSAAPPNCQNQEISQRTTEPLPSASPDAIAGCLPDSGAANEEYFSKPGVLRTQEPVSVISDDLEISNVDRGRSPIQQTWPKVEASHHDAAVETLSVTTNDLMISTSTTTALSQCVSDPIISAQNSTPQWNHPVEDHYESNCQSLQRESETREFTLNISEEPSVQNLNGQPPSMTGPITLGLSHSCETESLAQSVSEVQLSQHIESISQCIQGSNARDQTNPAPGLTCAEPGQATFLESELNASGQINFPPSEQKKESQGLLCQLQSNPYLITAAAIGMTAVFVAWRYK